MVRVTLTFLIYPIVYTNLVMNNTLFVYGEVVFTIDHYRVVTSFMSRNLPLKRVTLSRDRRPGSRLHSIEPGTRPTRMFQGLKFRYLLLQSDRND